MELVVKGQIPSYAAGVLYRTGPLGYKAKTDRNGVWAANHWFDGFSCVHRFEISFNDGTQTPKVTYNSRRTVDEMLNRVRKTGKLDGFTFAKKRDPCESFFQKVMSIFRPAPSAQNVGVTLSINMPGGGYTPQNKGTPGVNGHSTGIETLHIKTDADLLNEVDPETLEPRGVHRFTKLHPKLTGQLAAAHAETDPITGDIFNYNLELGPKPLYRVFQTSASTGQTEILATFQAAPAYIHSFFLTENYIVLCVWNSQLKWGGASILYYQNILDSIAPFDPSAKAKWYVIDRKGKGLVATYESDPFFSFHTINSWEEPSSKDTTKTDIICEISLYDNLDILHSFYYDNLVGTPKISKSGEVEKPASCLPHHAQFRLANIESQDSQIRPAELVSKADSMISMDLPTIHPAYSCRKHRYVYGPADRLKSSFVDAIVKFDNITQEAIFWEEEGHTPGEAIFVADPAGTEEDDGVLLSVVLDGVKEKSYLLVLRAKDLVELGRAEMSGPMAFGFHGAYRAAGRDFAVHL